MKRDLSTTELKTLKVLARMKRQKKYPSLDEIARERALSIASIWRHIEELIKAGLVQRRFGYRSYHLTVKGKRRARK